MYSASLRNSDNHLFPVQPEHRQNVRERRPATVAVVSRRRRSPLSTRRRVEELRTRRATPVGHLPADVRRNEGPDATDRRRSDLGRPHLVGHRDQRRRRKIQRRASNLELHVGLARPVRAGLEPGRRRKRPAAG